MVSYTKKANQGAFRRLSRKLMTQSTVNFAIVEIVSRLPSSVVWRSRIPVVNRRADLNLPNNERITMLDTDRCQVAKEIFWENGKLGRPADQLALELAIKLSRKDGIFIDIGAYTGMFALAVARCHPGIAAYAYEIVPENYLALWRNVFANNMVGQVIPKLIGLGADAGEICIPVSFDGGPLASSVALDAVEEQGVRIPIARLDDQFPDYTGHAVIKIDVETFEWPVLMGGRHFLDRNKPDIICEFLRKTQNIPELSADLRARGYAFYHITTSGLQPAAEIKPCAMERDWLLTTRSAASLQEIT
jgi:FkbM family methyltransferase